MVREMREGGWNVYAFGGTPRGVWEEGPNYVPRDFDLVFADEDFGAFESRFSHQIRRRNRFGGLNLHFGSFVVDAWPLSSTWAFKQGHITEVSFESLPRTTFLNVDAVVVEFIPRTVARPRSVFDAGFFSAVENRELDVNLAANPYPELCVIRTLRLAKRLRYSISVRLTEFLDRTLASSSEEDLLEVQRSHFGEVEFDRDSLTQIRHRIERHREQQPLWNFDFRGRCSARACVSREPQHRLL